MTGDLFDLVNTKKEAPSAAPTPPSGPLAHRMRPAELASFVGHDKIIGPGKALRYWIETDRVPSLILWGPPGSGKTTLARIVARHTQAHFVGLSAVLSGVRGIKEAVETARRYRDLQKRKTILFIDEIHRFNKSQQDALLPHVEDGTVTLVGATTENPSFELNSALLSRTRVLRLERLDPEDLEKVLKSALTDRERGLAQVLNLSDEAISWIAQTSEGDARRALTTLESVSLYAHGEQALSVEDCKKSLESALARQPIPYDKNGEEHYNVVSAFIKSIRASDPHAGVYYLARMLEAGEDPLFIARRLVILASEDIGNADPRALSVATACAQAVDFIGMPEARINLAQAVTYLASAPKSNASYQAISGAISEVRESGALPVPMHLRNAPTKLMKREGYGKGYGYSHQDQQGRNTQTHLPEKLVGKKFYQPRASGYEKRIKEQLDWLNPKVNQD